MGSVFTRATQGTDPSAGIVAAFKDSMIESGLEDGSHEGAVGAAAFLFRQVRTEPAPDEPGYLAGCCVAQASKIPVAKLAPRLKPLGFSDEHLAVLADGLVAHNEGLQPCEPTFLCLNGENRDVLKLRVAMCGAHQVRRCRYPTFVWR